MAISARLITLEGIDGAGKTTSIATIRARLSAHGIDSISTREPGGSAFGEALREILLHHGEMQICPDAETLAMFADRAQHLDEVVRPALAAGMWVVCDRFTDATYAYQGGGRGVAEARIAVLEEWVQGGLQPDLTLLFDVDDATADARANNNVAMAVAETAAAPPPQFDRFHEESRGFRRRVRESYLSRCQRLPGRFHLIDGGATPAQVQAQVTAVCDDFIAGAGR